MTASVIARLDSAVYAMLKDDLIESRHINDTVHESANVIRERRSDDIHQHQKIGKDYKDDKTESTDFID
jgi:hypothetical protein